MGWPGIYSLCFSQLDGGKDSFPLDGVFSAFIPIGLIRDNEGVVIEDYPTSLIGEIQLDSSDKLLLGIILFPLLVRFKLIEDFPTSVSGQCPGLGLLTGLTFSLGLASGPAHLFFKPYHLQKEIGL